MSPTWPEDIKVYVSSYTNPFGLKRGPTLAESRKMEELNIKARLDELVDNLEQLPSRMSSKVQKLNNHFKRHGWLMKSQTKQVLGIHNWFQINKKGVIK